MPCKPENVGKKSVTFQLKSVCFNYKDGSILKMCTLGSKRIQNCFNSEMLKERCVLVYTNQMGKYQEVKLMKLTHVFYKKNKNLSDFTDMKMYNYLMLKILNGFFEKRCSNNINNRNTVSFK